MELIADILLVAGSFGAAVYCYVLAARLKRFTTLESGMGGAIAVLSAQVDDMTVALDQARGAANGSASSLETLTVRAEVVAKRLELLVASLHDLPDANPGQPSGRVASAAVQPAPVQPAPVMPGPARASEARQPDPSRADPHPAEPHPAEPLPEPLAPDEDRRLRFVRRRATRDTLEAAE